MKLKRILAFVVCSLAILGAGAQQMGKLPLDNKVRYGQLPNGLTYYIRHNEKPKGQADFYIAQKVGSILEEENQRGLAHFLEHMCFNGTENFPGNSMIDWLESVGVKFGRNLNAMTGIDKTIYLITNVPVERQSVQDSVLLILHDWADGLLLDPEEIEKERGVIHEEWRSTMVGQQRILEKLLPDIYQGERYGYRLPIGTIDVIDNFKPEELRDYYETWYRPDQQGVIVVGDIDVDYIEGKIKDLFSGIEMPENAKPREYFPVKDNTGTIYAIGSDPEQRNAIIQIYFKQDAVPDPLKGTTGAYAFDYITTIITSILNERLGDIANKPDAQFAAASAGYDDFLVSATKDALIFAGLPKGNDVAPVLEAIYREALRAARQGFTQSEYDRAKSELLSRYEKAYNERENRENSSYVNEYVSNFTDGEAAPGIEVEWPLIQQIAGMVDLNTINSSVKSMVTGDNRVVMALLPENGNYTIPQEKDLEEILNKVDGEEIEAYVDEMRTDPFIPELPEPGKIISEKQLPQWDATELTLSNGIKVIVKPTKFKEDEILLSGVALGGTENISVADTSSIRFLPVAMSVLGLGKYNSSDVEKYLAGKHAGISPLFSTYIRSLSASSSPKDLPTMFELIYNYFTSPSIDENEFKTIVDAYASIFANQESQPSFNFQKSVSDHIYADPRMHSLTKDNVLSASHEKILDIIVSMNRNVADYSFVIVGNVDIETLKPLLEQYMATLPVSSESGIIYAAAPEHEVSVGKNSYTSTMAMQTPQTWVAIVVPGKLEFNERNIKLASIAGQILSARLLKTVREEMGAVYSISASGAMPRRGDVNVLIQSVFQMNPERKQEVLDFIASQFADMTENISNEEFSKVIEYMVKNSIQQKENNGAWLDAISGWSTTGVDFFNGDTEMYKSFTPADVKEFMKDLMKQQNYTVIVLDPEENNN